MFSFNSGQRLPKLGEVYQYWSLDPKGKLVIEFLSSLKKITPSIDDTRLEDIQLPSWGPIENINPEHAPADRFMDGNNDRLLDFDFPQLINQYRGRESRGLPSDFVSNICLNRIFTEPWKSADLTNALTGLDYLTNLECTRRTTLRKAAQRLRINENTWHSVLANNNEARAWIYSIQEQEDEIEQYYSTLWVDLRIWTMTKELTHEPFSKSNVIAMLNTLFPPVVKELPSLRISEKVLHRHRNSFYRYIVSIEVNGRSVLDGYIRNLDRPGTGHTWSDTRQTLKDYIKLADTMINQASRVHGISFFKNLHPEHPSMWSQRGNGTASTPSNPAWMSSSRIKPSHDELKRVSTKSDGQRENTENTDSVRSKIMSKDSPVSPSLKYFPASRSRVSGKPLFQRISSLDDVDTLFQDSPQAPWYSSPRRPSSVSGRSLETNSSGGRLHSSSFSRPLTPSIEQQKVHRRSSSLNKRISYDFRNALPGTPELPSPQATEKPNASKAPFAKQARIPSDMSALVQEPHEFKAPVIKKKKSAFNVFRRKKKPDNLSDSQPTICVLQDDGSRIDMSLNPGEATDGSHQPPERLFVREEQKLKKSSFRFLQGRKSHENLHVVSDSTSDRTITEATSQTIRTKRSFTNLFVNRGTLSSEAGENSRDAANAVGSVSGLRHTLRKAKSYSSVRSSSSTYSNDGPKNAPKFSASSVFDEDRIITSADITEPFPFGGFVQPQTPAMLFEDPEERKYIEDVRQDLLEKARRERMAKWEQSDEFKRKLEAARQKRKVLREEMDVNVQESKTARQKQKEEAERKLAQHAPVNAEPKTPSLEAQASDKPPKTPLKARILKEFASSYSPKSPTLS